MADDPKENDQGIGVPVLLWLAVATFSMGIDGYVLAGLLPAIAADLSVDVAAAGQLMAVFALTTAVAGPVLGALTGGWERRRVIVLSLAVFIAGNLLVAVAPAYGWAMAGRVISALGASLLNAAVSAYVIARTPVHRRGRALSFVLGGWLTATALGVPVGLVIGQTDWRAPLFLIAAVGLVALVGIRIKLPLLRGTGSGLRDALRPLGRPRLLGGLLVSTGVMCASYACFTYAALIVGPRVGGGLALVAVMFGYGLASLMGNVLTGRLSDRFRPENVLSVVILALLAASVLGWAGLLLPGLMGAVAAIAWFFVCAVGNGGFAVPQQARLGALAPESVAVVMALNGSAISLGSALGAGLGGASLTAGLGVDELLLVAGAVLLATLVLHLGVRATAALGARRVGQAP
ncbi:MFS transporter [Microbacterium sp. CIAB417]|uniref:MFS transporter n=1 Tax=Microbacterium sp. CIAB417 TaxID=2860287 RepID=UPI001FAD77E9|nr:MFS transporter [Microbacterium sp. CIAB417]